MCKCGDKQYLVWDEGFLVCLECGLAPENTDNYEEEWQ